MATASQLLAVIFVVVAYFYLSSDTNQQPTALQKFNQELLDRQLYPSFLEMAFVAASSGTNFLPSSRNLHEDCVGTAAAAMRLYTQPSTSDKIVPLMTPAFSEATDRLKPDTTLQQSVELVCAILNDAAKQEGVDLGDFDRLRRTVPLPKAAADSLLDVTDDQLTFESVQPRIGAIDDRQFLRYLIVSSFRMALADRRDTSNAAEYVSVTAAIYQLAERPEFGSAVDSEFGRVLEDYVENDILGHANLHKAQLAAISNSVFTRKVNQHFMENSALAEEYVKIKKAAADKYLNDEKMEKYTA